jgi:hypothetical protein
MPTMRLLLLITGKGVSLPVTELVLLPNLGDIRRNSPRLVGRRLISFFSSQPCRWQA